MSEDQKDHLEKLKLYFETYKHFATLSIAAPVLVVALFRDVATIDEVTVGLMLLMFGLALFSSMFGMYWVTSHLAHSRSGTGASFYWIVFLIGTFFGSAVLFLLVNLFWALV